MEIINTDSGYLARPKGMGPFSAVLVIQEWWGLNDHIKDITQRFAKEGFVAFAPDLYNGKITKDADEAAKLMNELKPDEGMKIIEKAFHLLQSQPLIKKNGIGITGFCMGGSFSLLAACRIPDLKASVPFYGYYPEKIEEIAKIKCPVLYFAGGRDGWINSQVVQKIEQAFQKYKINGSFQRYPDADHAFFNNTRPEVHHPQAAADAWKRAIEFFRKHL